MQPRRLLIACLCLLAVAFPALSQRARLDPPVGADWQRHAETYLINEKEGRPYSVTKDGATRCIRANNYGCLWQRTANWEGTPGLKGQNGAHDGAGLPGNNNGHAIFNHPKWSIIASMRWFETRTQGGARRLSAYRLAEIYMPWCDTIGSGGTRADANGRLWGRGCAGGQQPPTGFSGPICRAPAAGQGPSAAQCQACNCPDRGAQFWLRGTGVAIDTPLELFGSERRPTPLFLSLIGNKVRYETGRYVPTPQLMREALDAFRPEAR